MGDDRPFECTEPGCGMRFTNEDHLGVHKAKHEMCLALTSGNTKAGNVITFVADQTPTPTKFLRNCEEIGLFHELSKNPFEEAFKKAFAEGKVHDLHESSPFPGPLCDTEAVLNTPNPGLLLDDETHRREKLSSVKPIVTSALAVDNYIPLPGPNPEDGSTVKEELHTVASGSKQSRTPLLGTTGVIPPFGKPLQRWKSSSASGLLKSVSHELSTHDEDLDSPLDRDSSQDSMVLGVSSASSLTTSTSVLNSVLTSANTMLPESGGICFLQVMIKSPTGEVVPVALSTSVAVVTGASEAVDMVASTHGTTPASSGKPAKSSPTATLTSSSTSMGIASTTKQRLKAAIKQNVQQSVLQNNIQVMSDAVDLVTTQLQQASPGGTSRPTSRPASLVPAAVAETSTRLVKLSSSEVQFQDADTSTPKKARLSTEDDPDERRKKFLERNRAAAARCRQKKKVWVTSLEQRAEDLQTANDRLEVEVTQLRSEVVQLRAMLLAHKDCPVTQRQRALQGATQTEMQSDDVTSSSPIVITPNAEEIAMAALSTMASRSHVARGPPVIVTVSELLGEQP